MEANGIGGGMFSGINSVMLDLELSPQHHRDHQKPNKPNQTIVSFDQHALNPQSSLRQACLYDTTAKKSLQLTISDDDDVSPWQRMKWTDTMVKLLIMTVFYVGDDQAVSEGNDVAGKNKRVNGSGALQKKGKWKSVSKAMTERGFFVSPQQCEDKFNDLNKRFKRVNDILGKGTSCKVVEDQSLLERMDHLSPRMKEEVRKLLGSKHLFFREMCVYHNSCGGSAQHSSENSPNVPRLGRVETEDSKIIKIGSDDDEDDEDDEVEDGGRGHDKDSDIDVRTSHKRRRKEMYSSPCVQEFSNEVNYIVQNETKSSGEKRQWMRMRLMHLEEERMNYQREGYELEKKKMKWMRFSSRKDRNMEAEKLGNEKMRLENEKMVLVIKQTEVKQFDFEQESMACITGGMIHFCQ